MKIFFLSLAYCPSNCSSVAPLCSMLLPVFSLVNSNSGAWTSRISMTRKLLRTMESWAYPTPAKLEFAVVEISLQPPNHQRTVLWSLVSSVWFSRTFPSKMIIFLSPVFKSYSLFEVTIGKKIGSFCCPLIMPVY